MAPLVGRAALRAARVLRTAPIKSRNASTASTKAGDAGDQTLQKGAKRDPELYILATVMTGAFALAGYHFARNPTSGSSSQAVSMIQDSEPWQTGGKGKYQYHPGGDTSRPPKDAPSALHSVTVPDVNLPKHLHDHFNKYDKEEFEDY